MNLRVPIGVVAVVCWIGAACSPGAAGAAASDSLFVLGAIAPVQVQAGDTTTIVIPFEVAPGFHVQANPASNEFLVPLEFEAEDAAELLFVHVEYPPAIAHRLEGTEDDLRTYHGADSLVVRVAVPAATAPGSHVVAASLQYQVCDARRCFFPARVRFALEVIVSE